MNDTRRKYWSKGGMYDVMLHHALLLHLIFTIFQPAMSVTAKLLSLQYIDCDGGETASSSSSSNIHPREILAYEANSVSCVPDSMQTQLIYQKQFYRQNEFMCLLTCLVAYQTKTGRTKLTMILDAQETVQITKLVVRTQRGNSGAQCGLVFLLPYESVILKSK